MKKDLLVMGIETSCDETAVSIVKNGKEIVSNIVSSQIDSHKRFGGVVPEIASRHHVEQITIVLEEALKEAGVSYNDLDAIAVTEGPGLVGALIHWRKCCKGCCFCSWDSACFRTSHCWAYLCESFSERDGVSIIGSSRFRRSYGTCLHERTWSF